jgi:hypothetical protein
MNLAIPPADLEKPLRRVIARRRLHIALRIALATLLAALLALLVIRLLALASITVPDPALPVAIVALAALAIALFLAWRARRSRAASAMTIDSLSGLEQAYATALDLPATETGPVARLLRASVTSRLGDIAPHRLAPVFTPGLIAGATAAIALSWLALQKTPSATPSARTKRPGSTPCSTPWPAPWPNDAPSPPGTRVRIARSPSTIAAAPPPPTPM